VTTIVTATIVVTIITTMMMGIGSPISLRIIYWQDPDIIISRKSTRVIFY
jgi:hypothetical protein